MPSRNSICCPRPSDNYLNMPIQCVYLILAILYGILYGLAEITCAGSLKVFFENASHIVLVFIGARLSFHVPGLYSCAFYYLATFIIYKKIAKALDDYLHALHCDKKKFVFYAFLFGVFPAGAVFGFYEKLNKNYIPNAMIIDLLAVGFALRCKPEIIKNITDYYQIPGIDATYSLPVDRYLNWIESTITLFASARNFGMMVYCSGIVGAIGRFFGGTSKPTFNCM